MMCLLANVLPISERSDSQTRASLSGVVLGNRDGNGNDANGKNQIMMSLQLVCGSNQSVSVLLSSVGLFKEEMLQRSGEHAPLLNLFLRCRGTCPLIRERKFQTADSVYLDTVFSLGETYITHPWTSLSPLSARPHSPHGEQGGMLV